MSFAPSPGDIVAVEFKEGSKGLNCWADFFRGISIVWRVVTVSPVLVILSILLSAVVSFPWDNQSIETLAGLVESMLLMGLQVKTVYFTWTELTGEPHDAKHDMSNLTNAWWNGVLYGILCMIGTFLLIVPGIWCVYACCLGLPFVCLARHNPWTALEASRMLLQGNMKRAIAYLTPTAVVFGVLVFTAGLGMTVVIEFLVSLAAGTEEASSQYSVFSMIVLFVLNLWLKVVFMAQTTLQVRLFKELHDEKASQPAAA